MREIAIAFICFAGVLVLSFWVLALLLAVKSGKGVRSLFTRQRRYLSVADTIVQYGDNHTDVTD